MYLIRAQAGHAYFAAGFRLNINSSVEDIASITFQSFNL